MASSPSPSVAEVNRAAISPPSSFPSSSSTQTPNESAVCFETLQVHLARLELHKATSAGGCRPYLASWGV